ncbi:MAG: thiamine phosphate synthase [Gammaproteobacteria bacterium]|nr:thiamine phosphate synthase [Gammaproteobacteria bacterium]
MSVRIARGVYAITDCAGLSRAQLLARTEQILAAGVAALQYRNKNAPFREKLAQASRIHALCRTHGTPLIINDDVELALAIGAEGVHLGADDMSCEEARRRLGGEAAIGISCYDCLDTALSAQQCGADYVAFGAFFPTATKTSRARPELQLLRQARTVIELPLVAIGGITPDNAAQLIGAGADILAVVGSLYGSTQPADVVLRFNRVFAEHTGPSR